MCDKCKGSGWILHKDEKGRDVASPCECRAESINKNRVKASGVSEEFQKKGFKEFMTKNNQQLVQALNKAVNYYKNFFTNEKSRFNSILFAGQVGSGKTHLSMAIGNNLMTNQNVNLVYMPYRESITRIKQSVHDEYNYANEVNRFKRARVLIIDDLFKGTPTEADLKAIFEIINYRYLNNLPIIVSTEMTPMQMLMVDEGIASRIIEMSRNYTVIMEGKELNYRIYQ